MNTQIHILETLKTLLSGLDRNLDSCPETRRGQASQPHSVRRLAQVCGLLTLSLGLLGIVGWVVGQPTLTSISPKYVPTSLASAVAFVLLGATLLQITSGWAPELGARGAIIAPVIVVLVGSLNLAELLTGAGIG